MYYFKTIIKISIQIRKFEKPSQLLITTNTSYPYETFYFNELTILFWNQ